VPLVSRLGVTVTKKIDKRAARRNYIKRAVREWFRRAKNYLQDPVDIVVVALNGSAELSAREIWSELDDATKRARLIPRTFNFSPERSASAKGRESR
jgi:ribonuclease P protein component